MCRQYPCLEMTMLSKASNSPSRCTHPHIRTRALRCTLQCISGLTMASSGTTTNGVTTHCGRKPVSRTRPKLSTVLKRTILYVSASLGGPCASR
uniref:Uncharacterized protein n=1 Tax=Anguilla anguilla TaxID=7936 RepID=A0A0E9X708_ANGAN